MFESVDGRTHRCGLESHPINSPRAFGSGELKTGCPNHSTISVGNVLDSCPRGHKFECLPWLIVVSLSKNPLLSTGSTVWT